MSEDSVETLLQRYIEHLEHHGERLAPEQICAGREELIDGLRKLIRTYDELAETLEFSAVRRAPSEEPPSALPSIEGFRTVEQIGRGGMGVVYKLEDLSLGRTVAAKVLRPDRDISESFGRFLQEARSLALFQDDRIVRIYEYRPQAEASVIIMEYVDGFGLGRIGTSLEYTQRARVMAEICDAIHRAHELGIQHRDLKPANILLDARLKPKILDFGLSGSDPGVGHGAGTLEYMAPEHFDPQMEIDARTDVYALGIILFELLCGERPFQGNTVNEVTEAVRGAKPRLPAEIDSSVPEPLQAIALKAMEKSPTQRYSTAREMEKDLRRFLDGRPVLARPTLYASALEQRLHPHLEQIREWLELRLIYPHEAKDLRKEYDKLLARDDDWIVQARHLSFSQIALYLGAFLLAVGGLFYFGAHRVHEVIPGLLHPLFVLGLPFATLTAAALVLDRRELKAVANAFHLGASILLPIFLFILFHEVGWWVETEGQFFEGGAVSNRQLQVATGLAGGWALWHALRTRTVALSSIFSTLALLFTLAVLTDYGLKDWIEDGRWDQLAWHLAPLLLFAAVLGHFMERGGRSWLTIPLFLGAAGLYVLILELLALDGRELAYLGVSLAQFQPQEVADPELLDTLAAMTGNGLLVYGSAALLERYGSAVAQSAARFLFVLSPFAILEPIAYLNGSEEYARLYNWSYLALAVVITFLSRYRQRKSFFYAGLINTALALLLIAFRYEWFDVPEWSVFLVLCAVAVLLTGLALTLHERSRRQRSP